MGQVYLPQLAEAYALAWHAGAAAELEARKSISTALETVSKTWSSNRTHIYNHVLTPEFSKIVAESVNESDVSPAERAGARGRVAGVGSRAKTVIDRVFVLYLWDRCRREFGGRRRQGQFNDRNIRNQP